LTSTSNCSGAQLGVSRQRREEKTGEDQYRDDAAVLIHQVLLSGLIKRTELQIVEILCWLALKNHLASTSGRSRASWVPAALPPCDGQPVAAADLANPQATTTPTQHMNVLGERTGVPLGAVRRRRGRGDADPAAGRGPYFKLESGSTSTATSAYWASGCDLKGGRPEAGDRSQDHEHCCFATAYSLQPTECLEHAE